MLQGAVGMLYEQGSTRGLAMERADESVRRLADARVGGKTPLKRDWNPPIKGDDGRVVTITPPLGIAPSVFNDALVRLTESLL